MIPGVINRIFGIAGQDDFIKTTLEIFHYQADENEVYRKFLNLLRIRHSDIDSPERIPFIPASFFRDHKIITGKSGEELVFESSGTSGSAVSRHYVTDATVYRESFLKTFTLFYGDPSAFLIAALLPSYTERENSSLVFMMNELIRTSAITGSGFYTENVPALLSNINTARNKGEKIFLIGVSFALLDLAEKYSPDLEGVIVMETGGMKGRRKEITRNELHSILKRGFNVKSIHSEYGMTELLSQAYSKEGGMFHSPPWMKVIIRDPQDPLSVISEPGKTGGIDIIDLANVNSCSFIATDDMGRLHEDRSFEVLGRLDNSDIRGCNLLIE